MAWTGAWVSTRGVGIDSLAPYIGATIYTYRGSAAAYRVLINMLGVTALGLQFLLSIDYLRTAIEAYWAPVAVTASRVVDGIMLLCFHPQVTIMF